MTEVVDSHKDAMIRWQQNSLERRTSANAHFLAYAAAILALQISILIDNEVPTIGWSGFFITAGLFSITSLILGSIVVLVRLRDARLTARIARYRVNNRSEGEIEDLRDITVCLGMVTNVLIPIQVITFSLAALAFCCWVIASYGSKFT